MSTSTKIYGIKACDTMKKATTWLTNHDIEFEFHDYKKSGITQEKLEFWLSHVEWDQLINKRGTTWRKLSDEQKTDVNNQKAIVLMLENQSLIKRPLIEYNNQVYLGFKPETYETIYS
ncbi:arsenate reductase [Oleiphilus sp. HI0009]|uniref:ArsC family reductase n=1 Tax=unclassified Oleiphilus TaxID=2631174 RepID=UPI0007C3C0F6|nr:MULTISPECIES: ArsC family reductase [unclassified Oleiphilus]KZX78977.1 arsenate reductase [Oleiphilus sp. HI0009]MCH2159428.1 ArsC family reductase [Oleiphilaceae bacterium]KZX82941.1 arsenate reductase [Oleiphilus sp. HI0009]KZY66007.1 arsenate reductase [Oleiphilus sp. HI0066]KZY67668.1 arsenate reductase [Oleiphilus sp. HI0067]